MAHKIFTVSEFLDWSLFRGNQVLKLVQKKDHMVVAGILFYRGYTEFLLTLDPVWRKVKTSKDL